MTDEAILATTKSFRTLADGGVSITFDIDPKDAANAFRLFGITGSKVGIAAITAEAARKSVQKSAAEEKMTGRQSFTELRPSAQAAIRGGDPDFRRFLRENGHPNVRSEDTAADEIRRICRVGSRSELDTDSVAASQWRGLEASYYAWTHGRRE